MNVESAFEFTDGERYALKEMRALSTDQKGREILVGLTYEETSFYMEYGRRFLSRKRDRSGRERYLQLHNKHEIARLEVLGTEVYLRNENPPRH